MPMDDPEVEELVRVFGKFARHALNQAEPEERSPFPAMFEELLGVDPLGLPTVRRSYPVWQHVNLQVALDALGADPDITSECVGLRGGWSHQTATFSELLSPRSDYRIGPVGYAYQPSGPDRRMPCIASAVFLLRGGAAPAALSVQYKSDRYDAGLFVEVMTVEREDAEGLLDRIDELMSARNVYRGAMLTVEPNRDSGLDIHFHPRPQVARTDIVLPPGVLERVEAQVLGIAMRRDALRAAGRHVKRGILLYGPPGTGKTLCVRYFATEMPEATVLVLSGGGLGLVGETCALARTLTPAIVVLEDVDLVAQDRDIRPGHPNPVLFELLNGIDGMADDADITFILTTNRPDILEPALSARPGRVDLAVELPLPDDAGRQHLLTLYGAGLDLRLADSARVVQRTAGMTASFFKELLRRAYLRALDESAETIDDRVINDALDELLAPVNSLNRALLTGPDPSRAEGVNEPSRAKA